MTSRSSAQSRFARRWRGPIAGLVIIVSLGGCVALPSQDGAPTANDHSALPMPPSLVGTVAPRLPVDANGHLARVPEIQDFFDYCLLAEVDFAPDELDAFASEQIAQQVADRPAQAEALDVWRRYRAYDLGIRDIAGPDDAASRVDPSALERIVAAREAVARRTLGDWTDVFFADDFARARRDIAQLRAVQGPAFNETQALAIDDTLPADERSLRERRRARNKVMALIEQLQSDGASPTQMRQILQPRIGTAATKRLLQFDAQDKAWRTRYAAYAARRATIETSPLTVEQKAGQIDALRRQVFTGPGEIARAVSFDAYAGRPRGE
ncbi:MULTISPECIES: lipase secretion chaperone [Pandoraea]|uniref:lipase secretion chaperone n=1 Tax=Pandoraea TaxID=93217 RepID=UPI001F5C42AB|nr:MULTISPECIES: lipase secretion chaperone [Pandoraea]MCI3203489.1 lipase chaperone [Pandoraea sp. LA3]MDN4581515.1 lipase chaperone [Pandoraea capi]